MILEKRVFKEEISKVLSREKSKLEFFFTSISIQTLKFISSKGRKQFLMTKKNGKSMSDENQEILSRNFCVFLEIRR